MGNSFKTYLKHTYKDFKNRSVNPPLVRTSTMVFKSMKDLRQTQKKNLKNQKGGHFEYGRQGTSTTFELEKMLTKWLLKIFGDYEAIANNSKGLEVALD